MLIELASARAAADELGRQHHTIPDRLASKLILDGIDGLVRHPIEWLGHGRQGRTSQSCQRKVVETGHWNIPRHTPTPLAKSLDGTDGHVVICGHDTVELGPRGDDIVHGNTSLLGHEVTTCHQRWIQRNTVSVQDALEGLESRLRLGVIRCSREKHRTANPVVAHHVLDYGLHAARIVEHQAGNSRQRQSDTAQTGRPVALHQTGDRVWTAEGRKHARDDNDSIEAARPQRPKDGVVRRAQWAWRIEGTTIQQQEVVPILAALGIERLAQVRLIAA